MLELNENKMATAWSPETPITMLSKQINDGIKFVKANGDNMPDLRPQEFCSRQSVPPVISIALFKIGARSQLKKDVDRVQEPLNYRLP